MIRRATVEDLPALLPLGEEFFERFPGAAPGPFDPHHWLTLWEAILASGEGFIVMADDASAALGVVIYPDTLTGQRVATGMFWVSAGMRGGQHTIALLRGAEEWARKAQAVQLDMASLGDRESPARIYERRGYRVSHVSYAKEL